MRFSVDGYCQGCQQRVEYVIRERSSTSERKNLRSAIGEGVKA